MNLADLAEIAVFPINAVVGLYVSIVMLRFFLTLTQADYYNPVSRFVVACTRAPVALLRRVAPTRGRVDFAVLVLMVVIQALGGMTVFTLLQQPFNPGLLVLWTLAKLVDAAFSLFWFSVLLSALLSWLGPTTLTPVRSVLYSLTEPLLRPVRSIVPSISGIDLSPLLVLIGLESLKRLLVDVITAAMSGFVG